MCLLSEEVAILREFGEDYEWFVKSRSMLLSKYANKWVVIHKKKILDFDNELTPLLNRLRNKGLKPEQLLRVPLTRVLGSNSELGGLMGLRGGLTFLLRLF